MNRLLLIALIPLMLVGSVRADDFYSSEGRQREYAPARTIVGILPPLIKTEQTSQTSDETLNPLSLMRTIIPMLAKEGQKRQWPFDFMPPSQLEPIYLGVVGKSASENVELNFYDLKPIAEKAKVRYLMRFTINELAAYHGTNTILPSNKARANVDLVIYDAEKDAYVWQDSIVAESQKSSARFLLGALSKRRDQALLSALSRTIDPFANGARKDIGRPEFNVIATVVKPLGDGKQVLLDVGKKSNVFAGSLFKSIESDAIIKVTDVLDNGSIAEVVNGSPKANEVFKPYDGEKAKAAGNDKAQNGDKKSDDSGGKD